MLMEQRKASGYGNPATTACLFPSGEPLALLAISSVFICLSACILLYLLMCLSLSHYMPPRLELVFLKADTAYIFLPEAGHKCALSMGPYHFSGGQSTPHEKEQNQILSCTVLHSLCFSVPCMYLIISLPCPKGVQDTGPLCVLCSDTVGGWALA